MTVIKPPSDTTKEIPKEQSKNSENATPQNNSSDSQWGYDLYPERRQHSGGSRSFSDVLVGLKGREELRKMDCEKSVYKCIKQSPIIRLMMGALKASGCPVDIRRHFSCEDCAPNVSGGYDPVLNQVVICHNNSFREEYVNSVMLHEMIHMFDYCKNNMEFKNLDHLACTEIRAANLAHCSFFSAWTNGDSSLFNFRATHQNCVKSKALSSMLAIKEVKSLDAIDAIERVFTKCYNDLEPIGRRIRRNSFDMTKAFRDGFYYGYDDGA